MTPAKLGFWALVAVTLAIYGTMLAWSLPYLASAAGGLVPFDMRPAGYSEAEARAFLAALGDDGRDFYLHVQQRLDLPYPILVGLVFALSFRFLYRDLPVWAQAVPILLAVAGAGFDVLENHRVAGLLTVPAADVTGESIASASFATLMKSLCNTICAIALLAGILRWFLQRRARRAA